MVPETRVIRAADGEDLVILAWTVFYWSTCVTDGRTDRRTDGRTELRWLRRAKAVAAFVHKNPMVLSLYGLHFSNCLEKLFLGFTDLCDLRFFKQMIENSWRYFFSFVKMLFIS